MPVIKIDTYIHSPVETVFDLSRSIDLHHISMQHTNEKPVAGRISGLIQLNETVTWQAKHLFRKRSLTVQITVMQPYSMFTDEMLQGDFKHMKHEHKFFYNSGVTHMQDVFEFRSPYGIAGTIFDLFFLKGYMSKLLQQRNKIIKDYAESGRWKSILN